MTSINIIRRTEKSIHPSTLQDEIKSLLDKDFKLSFTSDSLSNNLTNLYFDYHNYINMLRISNINIINVEKLLKYECVIPIEKIIIEDITGKSENIPKKNIEDNKQNSINIFIKNPTTFYSEKNYKYTIRKSILNQRNYDIFNGNFYIVKNKNVTIISLIINFNKFIKNVKKYISSNGYNDELISCNYSTNVYNIFQSYIVNTIDLKNADIIHKYKGKNNVLLIKKINNNVITDILIFFNNIFEFLNNYIIRYSYNTVVENILYVNNKSLVLQSNSYKQLYNLYNPFIDNVIANDKKVIINFVPDNVKKIIIKNKINISTFNKLAFINDLNNNYNKYFNNIILLNYGIDVDKNYKILSNLSTNIDITDDYKKKSSNIQNILSFYRITSLFIKKYGIDKYKELYNKILNINIIRKPLNYKLIDITKYIEKNILNILTLELNRTEILKTKNTNYPWFSIYSNFALEKFTIAKIELYKKLRTYIPKKYLISIDIKKTPDITEYINIDGIDIICPHTKDKYELILQKININEVDNYIIKYYSQLDNVFNNTCKICGEILSKNRVLYGLEYSASTSEYNQDMNELKQKLYKKCMTIIYSFIDYEGDNLFKKQLIRKSSDELYQYIKELEIKLSEVKNQPREIINYRLDMFMSIYVYAFITRFYLSNFPNINLKYLSNYHNIRSKELNKITKETVDQIIKYNNYNINKIQAFIGSEITVGYITKIFNKLLNNLSNIDEKIIKEKDDPEVYMSYFLYNNLLYNMLYKIHLIHNMKNKDITYKNYIFQVVPKSLNVINVLGYNIPRLIKQPYLFNDVKNPLQKNKIIPYTNDELKNKYEVIQNFNNKYYNEILYNLIDYIITYAQKYYNKTPFTISGKAKITYNQELINFKNGFNNISKIYNNYRRSYIYSFLKPFNNIHRNQNPSIFTSYHTHEFLYLNYTYGVNNINNLYTDIVKNQFNKVVKPMGLHKHIWDCGIFTKLDSFIKNRYDLKKYNKNNLTIISKNDIKFNKDFIFLKSLCSICYNTNNEFYKDIKQETDKYFKHVSFNNLVVRICPEQTSKKYGDTLFHVFKNDTCKLCGYKANSQVSEQYFNKYTKSFSKYLSHDRVIISKNYNVDYKYDVNNIGNTLNTDIYNNTINEFINVYTAISKEKIKCDHKYKINKLNEQEFIYIIKNIGLFDGNVVEENISSKQPLDVTKVGIMNIKNIILYFNSTISKIKNNLVIFDNIKFIDNINIQEIHKMTMSKLGKYQSFNTLCYTLLNVYKFTDHDKKNYNKKILSNYKILASYLFLFLLNTYNYIVSIKVNPNTATCIFLYMINYLYIDTLAKGKLSDKEISQIKTGYIVEDLSNIVDNRNESSYDDLIDENAINEFSYENFDYDGENDDD